ncbi:NAD-dependent epimerase/dehydratase family protein [Staphylococcus arlettae]|uniref:NAD-dependent epimerase/dehydratase family protein n=1 Tax=Staphylococcus arlettae TaxID=29378 RepID=UPI001E340728|nr:NAD-dependent epimerase/dehydratase family protein [Staphylococcus arlettae]MCD8839818.1 NAD-dependent epimerase/dehydratase family protein [Staphylococcus arlettae]MCD8867327.1 NAD-dependent epimerase/dehydratase family protein [Staphylococcus arlettae]
MAKHILITGSSGYVGSHLADSLEQLGNKVSRLNVKNTLWKELDFKQYDAIIHTAALVHNNDPNAQLAEYFRVNMHLTFNLAMEAKKCGVKHFVFMSTMAVFGEDGKIGEMIELTNPTNLKPVTNYGISKAKAEAKIREIADDNFKVAIIRPPMIYGVGSPGNFTKLIKVAKRLPIIPNLSNARSVLYIKHLEQFVNEIIKHEMTGIYHPKDKFEFNTTKVVTEIRKNEHKNTFLLPIPKAMYPILNKFRVISKIYGNLLYAKSLYAHESKVAIDNQKFETIIKDIMNKY